MNRRDLIKSTALLGGSALVGGAGVPCETPRSVAAPYDLRRFTNREAPFGGEVSADIVNYSRAAPSLATAGLLKGNGVEEVRRLGFRLIVDVRRPDEPGVDEEQEAAKRSGIDYVNWPFSSGEDAWEQVSSVAQALETPESFPIMLHCRSANRTGAIWSLYRARYHNVAPITAIEEGRAIGLKSREAQVRELLSVPHL